MPYKVTNCFDPGYTAPNGYGNGLIKLKAIQIAHNGVNNDITVCQVVTDTGEVKNYLPLRDKQTQSVSKELVKYVHWSKCDL